MKNKPLYWYKQSSVIPFQFEKNILKLLVITSVKKKKWIFPKGIIEQNLTPKESAIKEAFEEAGVSGELLETQLGNYSYKKWGGKCEVRVYGLKVTEILNDYEENFRERKWIEIGEVEQYIQNKKLFNIVKYLDEYLRSTK